MAPYSQCCNIELIGDFINYLVVIKFYHGIRLIKTSVSLGLSIFFSGRVFGNIIENDPFYTNFIYR